ncbi:MAG TPA: Mur ligase domain-containing protein [Phycisphaerales bacterium]|nr:Mur ligase domain-containing protein [Phycisphaerales bacterium]
MQPSDGPLPLGSHRSASTNGVEPKGGVQPSPALALAGDLSREDRFEVDGVRVWMIGIGGSGMSGLARILKGRGAVVCGSDQEESDLTKSLEAAGVEVDFDQSRGHLPQDCGLVIASAAVRPDHPQWMEAERRGLPVLLYAEAIGKCMLGRTGMCIAGTHGKSTTTAMLGCVLTDCGLDPTVIVGATSTQLLHGCLAGSDRDVTPGATGFRLGSAAVPRGVLAGGPGLLVAESCEFNRSFHNFHPTIASISSVEADHLDVYGTLEAVIEAFHQFARLLPSAAAGGRLLIAHDGAHRREVTRGLDCAVETIGFTPEADYVVTFDPLTRAVQLSHQHMTIARWTNIVPGAHNAFNASVALVLAIWAGADPARAAMSLAHFGGIDRRMQFLGERGVPGGTARVYDDYGHHPTEIEVTLRALREAERPELRAGRLICVFQPHQHSRTRHLLEEFANSFSQADIVIVPHIYFVRDSEEERQKVTADDLVARLREKGVKALHLSPFETIVEHLQTLVRPGDVVVTMGAGPVWQVARGFLAAKAAGAVA